MPCGRPGRGTQQSRSHPKPFWDRDTPSYPRTGQGWVGQDPPAQIDPPHLKGVRPLLAARQGWGSTGNPGAPPPPSVGAQWNQVWGQQVTRQEPGRAAQPQMTRTRTTASVRGLGVCSSPGRWGLMCVCHSRLRRPAERGVQKGFLPLLSKHSAFNLQVFARVTLSATP